MNICPQHNLTYVKVLLTQSRFLEKSIQYCNHSLFVEHVSPSCESMFAFNRDPLNPGTIYTEIIHFDGKCMAK